MRVKRIAMTALLACTIFFFSGCNLVSLNLDTVLSPPKLTDEQKQIYDALVEQVGSNIQLKYPKSGEYRSAFVIYDINGDGEEEALVFYQPDANSSTGANLRVNVLKKDKEGNWRSTYEIAGEGSDVDKLMFANLGYGEEETSIIIGYSSTGGTEKHFKIYNYTESGRLEGNIYEESYSLLDLLPDNGEGKERLFFVSTSQETGTAQPTGKLLNCSGTAFQVTAEIRMNRNVTEYVSVSHNQFENVTSIYIDGLEGGSVMCTEVIVYRDGMISNPLLEAEQLETTQRAAGIYCRDIDLDGNVEIPTQEYMPGYSASSREAFYVTGWKSYHPESQEFYLKTQTYLNSNDGYALELPEAWIGHVTAKLSADSTDVKFFVFQNSLDEDTQEIFRLKTVSRTKLSEELETGYVEVASIGQLSYVAKIAEEVPEEYRISISTLKGMFISIVK